MKRLLLQTTGLLMVALMSACTATSSPAPTLTTAPAIQPADTQAPTHPDTAVPPTATIMSATATTPPTAMPSPTVEVIAEPDQDNSDVMETNKMKLTIGDTVLTATLANNSSVDALKEALAEGPIMIEMREYGNMEKVGPLGFNLPRNDEQITTRAGDIILYQGNALVIYYAPNSWNFTKLGRIDDLTADELKGILGNGDVTITLSLP